VEHMLGRMAQVMLDSDTVGQLSRHTAEQLGGENRILARSRQVNLIRLTAESVQFTDRSLRDFFAAAVFDRAVLDRVSSVRFSPQGERVGTRFDAVVHFVAAASPHAESFMRHLLEIDPFLASMCLADGINVSAELWHQVVDILMMSANDDQAAGQAFSQRMLKTLRIHSLRESLLRRMRSGTWQARTTADQVLVTHDAGLPPGMFTALAQWDNAPNDAAAQAIRDAGGAAIPVFRARLLSESWEIRRSGVWALGVIGDRAAVPGLVAVLNDEDALVRKEAAAALGEIGDSAALPALTAMLRDEDRVVRKSAMDAMLKFNEASIIYFSETLRDAPDDLRITCMRALRTIGGSAVIPTLMHALNDSNADVRSEAIIGLTTPEAGEAEAALVACLADTARGTNADKPVNYLAADALFALATPTAQSAAEAWLRDGIVSTDATPSIHDETPTTHAGEMSAREAHPSLAWEAMDEAHEWENVLPMTNDSDPIAADLLAFDEYEVTLNHRLSLLASQDREVLLVTLNALEALMHDSRVQTEVENLLNHPDPDVRTQARHMRLEPIVDELPNPYAEPQINEQWDTVPLPQEIAAQSLEFDEQLDTGSTQTSIPIDELLPALEEPPWEALPALIDAMKSESFAVRVKAQEAIQEEARRRSGIESPRTIQILANAMRDADSDTLAVCVMALAWLKDDGALPYLYECLRDSRFTIRLLAIQGIQHIGSSQAVPALIDLLRDPQPKVRQSTISTLRSLNAVSALPVVAELLKDRSVFVRCSAANFLGELGDESICPPLIYALTDGDPNVRWWAADALLKIKSASTVTALSRNLEDYAKVSFDVRRVCDVAAEALETINTDESRRAVALWNAKNKLNRSANT
jgi:HEAT repeat protein